MYGRRPLAPQLVGHGLELVAPERDLGPPVARGSIPQAFEHPDVGGQQARHQGVAAQVGAGAAPARAQQDHGLEAGCSRGGGEDSRVVRLRKAPSGDERVRALGERIADEELRLPDLVAPERQPGEVVALDEDPPAQPPRQMRELMHGCLAVQQRKPRQQVEPLLQLVRAT